MMKKIGLVLLVFLVVKGYAQNISNHIYYVSSLGSDISSGSITRPFKTIQKAVNVSKGGDIIYIRQGTYRESIVVPVTKPNISLFGYKAEKATLKGSDIATGWTAVGSYWKKYWPVQPQQVMINGDNSLQQIGYPNKNFKDVQTYLRYNYPVGAGLADMQPGRFYWENGTLYIWLDKNENPNKCIVEVSKRMQILTIWAKDVHLKNLYFRHSNVNTFAEQGAAVTLGNNGIIEQCDIQWTDFAGLALTSNCKAYNCNISNNGSVGFSLWAAFNFLVSNCRANYNNRRNFSSNWHAGGFKATGASWGTVEKSEFANNIGPGIWFDYCFQQDTYRKDGPRPIIVRGNYVHDNSKTANKNAAIEIEMSENATVQDNILMRNGFVGIYVNASWNCNIINNVITQNTGYIALSLSGMPRVGEKRAKISDNNIRGNIIANNKTLIDIYIMPDNGVDIKNNRSDYNSIYKDYGKMFLRSNGDFTDVKDWQEKTPFDKHMVNRRLIARDTVWRSDKLTPK